MSNEKKRWYVLQTQAMFENKARESLEREVQQAGLQDFFGRILVPTESVFEMKAGQKRRSERKFFPGYIHKYDKKYFYKEVARKDGILYTNDLTDLGIAEQFILLKDIPVIFKTLINQKVPRDVQQRIDNLFPEVIPYHDSSQITKP